MKRIVICLIGFIALSSKAQTTVKDTVSTSANYVNQIWYSLNNDEVGSQPKDNWDLAFELTGFNSSILVNTQKSGEAVYLSPFNWNEWSTFDTAGYKSWPALHNSDTSWEIGALNRPGIYNTEDMGWGSYNMNSHAILGTRLYLLVLPGNKFYQLGIKSLIAGTYTATYKTLDNTDSVTFTVKKSDFVARQFAYYDIASKSTLNREPDNTSWDLTFTKYIYNNYPIGNGQFMPYGVTGVLFNKYMTAAELRKVDVNSNVDFSKLQYTAKINEVGSDWKTFNNSTFQWTITDSLMYIVEDIENNYWKLIMTGFSGSTAGKYMFSKEKLQNVSVTTLSTNNTISVFPNPANQNGDLNLVFNFQSNENVIVSITDMSGRSVHQSIFNNVNGYQAVSLPLALNQGMYNITFTSANHSSSQIILVK